MGDLPQDNGRRLFGSNWPWVAAVVVVAVLAAWPAISQPGLLNTRGGGDSPFLLQRLHQLTAALADGHFPARWMPDANYGYGYPFYNFYAPLSIYVAAVFRFLGFSFVRAIHLAQLAGFIVAGLGMFHLGRRWLGSRWAGLLAAVAYTVAPFHMVNVYVRGDSLAEFWAMAFYPVVLLAAEGIFTTVDGQPPTAARNRRSAVGRRPSVALFALAYAALILSHNISALIFSPFLALYLAVRLLTADRRPPTAESGPPTIDVSASPPLPDSRRANAAHAPLLPFSLSPLLHTFAALALALALAAWFFVPALAEQALAQLGPVTEGYFHYSNHFRGLDLVQGKLLFDYNPDGGVAFRLGLVQVALAVVGAAALLIRRPPTADRRPPLVDPRLTRRGSSPPATGHSPLVTFSVVGSRQSAVTLLCTLFAIFMITPLSRPLWDHLPLLSFAQFPWRFLSIASFFMAVLTGGLVRVTTQPPARAAIAGMAGLVLLAAALLGLRVDHLILTDADVTAERLAQYEWFTGNIGTTVSAEYLTPESTPRPWTSAWLNTAERDRIVPLSGALEAAELLEREATNQSWRIDAGIDGAAVGFPTLYWPGWRATIDRQPAELRALPSSGLMALTIPPGDHTVALALERTPVRAAAEAASLAAAVVTGVLLVVGSMGAGEKGRKGEGKPEGTRSFGGRWSAVGGLLVVGLLLAALALLWRNDPRELPHGDLTWDFAQMAYLHHDVGGIAFDDGSRLHEYGYSADELAAGQTLTVTLSLSPGSAGAATLALVTPASARPTPDGTADPPVIAVATRPLDGESVVFTLPISPDAPPGLYVPRLTIDGTRPLMPSGGTRGDLFLRPVRLKTAEDMVSGEAGEQGSRGAGAIVDPLDIRATSLIMRDAHTLDGRFAWYTGRTLGTRYQFSWRVQDAAGGILAQLDAQPGYGYQPSTLWPAGQWTADWLALRLPDAAPAVGEYPLVMRLYDVGTGEAMLTRRVGVLTWDGAWQPRLHEPSFTLPDDLMPLDVTFGSSVEPSIALRGYRLEQERHTLRLTLYWQALTNLPDEYTRFVHLIDAAGAVVAQVDGQPAGNSYPTGQWVAGEVVADPLTFDLSALPPGEYRLATGFYRPADGTRLEASAADGSLPDGRALLPNSVVVPDPEE